MVTLYGQFMSRAMRCLWTLEELGIDYEHVKTNQQAGESHTDEYKSINPNGRVPAMTDGDLVMCESMAINMYLAKKYGTGSLWPTQVEHEGSVMQWAIWASLEVEWFVVDYLRHAVIYPEDKRKPELAERALEILPQPLAILNDHLKDRDYMVGGGFTVADINVSSVLLLADIYKQLGVAQYPHILEWLEQCCASRPAFQKLPSLK